MATREQTTQLRDRRNGGAEGRPRRSSEYPRDIEKGIPLPRRESELSEDEKALSIVQPVLPSQPKQVGENGGFRHRAESQDDRKPVTNKHWRPSKIWFLVVFLGLAACWIPAILSWTKFPNARVWGVKLLFWSIWLSIFWAGWWFALVFSWVVHRILLTLVHFLSAFKLKRYVNWLEYLHGYFALVAWTLALWITWVPLIDERQLNDGTPESASSRSVRVVDLCGRLFFALACSVGILFVEKIAVQWIAMKFHERSYKRRIEAQQEAVRTFQALYAAIRTNPLSADATFNFPEKRPGSQKKSSSKKLETKTSIGTWTNSMYPTAAHQQFNYHHREIQRAPTSTLQTAFTDVTGQIFGTGILPEDDVVASAFHRDGSRKMKLLAEDMWQGIAKGSGVANDTPRATHIKKLNIEHLLSGSDPDPLKGTKAVTADQIWKVLTGGLPHLGKINEGEFTTKCSDLHAEQRRLEETMNDLHNVVGRLDDLLMLFWVIGSILIFAVALEAELKTLIFGAGSTFVGASWLLRDTASEVLASIVFLFSKHPFDVEDMVVINGKRYTVVEMRLLSTVFYDDDSVQVQAPNSLLNTCFIHNLRRSPATSEPFTVEVCDRTTTQQLEKFKASMMQFLKDNPKEYREEFDVVIKELSALKIVLAMDINYNNNWETDNRARAQRRNAWICHLRQALDEAKIEGPGTPSMKLIREEAR